MFATSRSAQAVAGSALLLSLACTEPVAPPDRSAAQADELAAPAANRGEDPGELEAEGAPASSVEDLARERSWSAMQNLLPDSAVAERFGTSLSADGALLAIGAPSASGSPAAPGHVYLFERGDGGFRRIQALEAPADVGASFGAAVALSGHTLAVGAPEADAGAPNRAGAVLVYVREDDQFRLETTLHPPRAEAWQAFGGALAVDHARIVVGSSGRDYGSQADAGAAYVYEREDGAAFRLTWELSAAEPRAQDHFGHAVATLDRRILVSAPLRDAGARGDVGSVYAYRRTEDAVELEQILSAPEASAQAQFGASLALSYAAGFAQQLLVGAPQSSVEGRPGAGAAYLFEAPEAGAYAEVQELVASAPQAHGGFASRVSLGRGIALIGGADADVQLLTRASQGFAGSLVLAPQRAEGGLSGSLAVAADCAFATLSRAAPEASAVQVFQLLPSH